MKVILGVTGCIAAYKSPEVLRQLQKREAEVRVVMTRHAREFIGPVTFEALSGQPVVWDMFEPELNTEIRHISLARWGELLLIAPTTANIIAKFAHGLADDFLTTLFLSVTCPTLLAPAMNVEMWHHPATQENLALLRSRGVHVLEPDDGYLACGDEGEGRMSDPALIADRSLEVAAAPYGRDAADLTGIRVLVTAGPTLEDIDPVRFLGNRSSGKMGFALARAARIRGAHVTLVSGPTALGDPPGTEVIRIRTAEEMRRVVLERFEAAQVVIMAAAVADFRPAEFHSRKIKKTDHPVALDLVPTVDILAEMAKRKHGQLLVGFAAETENVMRNGKVKLESKKLDLLVGNDVSRADIGFGADFNEGIVMDRAGGIHKLSKATKDQIAHQILDHVRTLMVEQKLVPAAG